MANWHSRAATACVALALTLAAGCGGPAEPVQEPAGQPGPRVDPSPRMVFASDRSGAWRIWTMLPDGTAARPFTEGPATVNDTDPVFSPDGRWVLFTSDRDGRVGLWIKHLATGEPTRVCDGDQGDWSPDGTHIAFRRGGRIVKRRLLDGLETGVTPAGWLQCSGPAWSPDGGTIAFACRWEGDNGLYLIAADGGKPARLYDREEASQPAWNPDGARLVCRTATGICSLRADGRDRCIIADRGRAFQRDPCYGPEGGRIVFAQSPDPDGPWSLFTVAVSRGGTLQRITGDGSDIQPDWK
jgi:Tol biopolymer transport system component